jgi:hypothetical protein
LPARRADADLEGVTMKKSYKKWAEKETGSQLRLVTLKAMVEREVGSS